MLTGAFAPIELAIIRRAATTGMSAALPSVSRVVRPACFPSWFHDRTPVARNLNSSTGLMASRTTVSPSRGRGRVVISMVERSMVAARRMARLLHKSRPQWGRQERVLGIVPQDTRGFMGSGEQSGAIGRSTDPR